jgi:uncharacterized membrane protein YvbJ
MALIKCPECDTEVSDKADKCLKCAYPINATSQNSANNQPVRVQGEGAFLQKMNVGSYIVLAFIIAIVVLIIIAAYFF